ncbi:hypothetical protein BGZ72_002218 [Mortierella alpina]|nr:hypothetical protein BGZ72_002218 [Mortierella alpina]
MAPSAAPSAKGATRELKESTRLFHKLRGKYHSCALPLGTIRCCLQNNLAGSGLRQNQNDQVKEMMQQAVVMANLIVQRLYLATVLLITASTNGDPRLARSVNVSKQNAALYLKAITGSPSFVYCLARRLYQGNPEIPRGKEACDAASAACHAFKLFQVEAGKVLAPLKASYPIHIGNPALDLAVQHVFTAIRSHYENAQFLQVDADPNTSVIQKFFALNAKEKRYKDFPKARFTPSWITLFEDGLCHLLYGNSPSENILGVVLKLHGAEVKKMPIISIRRKTAGGPFIEQYVAFTQHHTAILVRTLFGTGAHENVLLISDQHSKDSRVLRPAFHTDGLTITLLAHNLAMPKQKKFDDGGGGGGGDGGADEPKVGDIKGKGVQRDIKGRGSAQRSLRIRRGTALSSSSAGSDDDEGHARQLQTAIKASRASLRQERAFLMQQGAGGASSSSAGGALSRRPPPGGLAQSGGSPSHSSGSSSNREGEGSSAGDDGDDDDDDDDDEDDDGDDGSELQCGPLELPADFDDEEDINNLNPSSSRPPKRHSRTFPDPRPPIPTR